MFKIERVRFSDLHSLFAVMQFISIVFHTLLELIDGTGIQAAVCGCLSSHLGLSYHIGSTGMPFLGTCQRKPIMDRTFCFVRLSC